MRDSLESLPNHEPVLKAVNNMEKELLSSVDYSDLGEPMKDFLNDMQLGIAALHTRITQNWFTYQEE